jgi:hypothetical protein
VARPVLEFSDGDAFFQLCIQVGRGNQERRGKEEKAIALHVGSSNDDAEYKEGMSELPHG